MAEPTSPAPPPDTAPPPPRRRGPLRRLLSSFGIYLLGVAGSALVVAGAFWWLLFTETGGQWLLARIPGVQVSGVSGHLLGPFSAQQLELPLPGEGARLRLQQFGWSAPRLRWGTGSKWLHLGFDEMRASRVDLWLSTEPSSDSTPPTNLELPLGVDIEALRVDEFHVDGLATPARQLRARLALSADGGARHVLDAVSADWDRLRFSGGAQLGTRAALPLQATLQVAQHPPGDGEWAAALQLTGPLAAPQLQATLRGRAAASRPQQTLDASATLRPFAAWPLDELQATARALDLSALHSDAPRTALDLDASASTQALDLPAAITLRLRNHDAGRWNERRLPLRALTLQLQARPDEPSRLDVQAFEADLGGSAAAGRISGSGQWAPDGWRFDTRLQALQPQALDVRAPQMRLDGRLQLDGRGFDTANAAEVEVRGQLDGQRLGAGPAQPVQVRLDARLSQRHIELRQLLAQAGEARASVEGRLTRASTTAPWAARGQASLREFDPLPWWPGRADSPWRQGPHRLNAHADVELTLPTAAGSAAQWLSRLRGRAQLVLEPSRLAGVPLSGNLALQATAGGNATGQLQLLADGNQLRADASWDGSGDGRGDRWDLKADLPALRKLQPLWKLLLAPGSDARLGGQLQAQARLDGRWPSVATQGRFEAGGPLQLGALLIKRAEARWTLGSTDDAPLDAQLELSQLSQGPRSAEQVKLQLQGTPRAHTLTLQGESTALPPAWVEAVQNAPAGTRSKRTLAELRLGGGVIGSAAGRGATPRGWQGKLLKAELRGDAPAAMPWLQVGEFGVEVQWADTPLRVKADAGRAELLGAALNWSRIAWSAEDPGRAPAKLDAEARLEPLDVAPLLKRAQPYFGWGGDLRLGGHLVLRSAPSFHADIVVERASGDLSVTDEAGTRMLGLSDLRIGMTALDGVWSFTTGLAGATLGRAAGAVVARSTPQATWPRADAPLNGVLELQINDLGVWGPWLPPGWRLTGALHANASIGGRFGAPEFEGRLDGGGIGVRNLLQGVDVRDGDVAIALLGDTARIERFSAQAGKGSLNLRGDASLGAAPRAELNLKLEQFLLLGRIDRRIVASGGATLRLGKDTLALNGDFRVDEGLIDFSRSEAPRLSDDVTIYRGASGDFQFTSVSAAETEAASARARRSTLDLRVQLGEKLRIRGQGLDAGLRGELRLSAPQGRLRVDGSVRTVDGTYRAYRQRLNIERGVLTFNGPIENPQLDIEAIRPNLDVRVGVAVTGTVLVPRVRLFSDPDMSDADKLSWLLRGRASEGAGSGDTALLQAAAMALISGDEPNALDQFFNVFGLDDLSVRQSDNAGGGAIVSVGKQLSRNWYVGYERGLNATTGNWQLIYRIAQRFTVRAQSGEQNSIELIWSWRWN